MNDLNQRFYQTVSLKPKTLTLFPLISVLPSFGTHQI